MRGLNFLLMGLLLTVLCACSGVDTYVSRHAEPFTKPQALMSLPAETASEVVTVFSVVLNPGLFTEMVVMGGIWPIVAVKPDGDFVRQANGEILIGELILAPTAEHKLPMNPFGDIMPIARFHCPAKDLDGAKLIYQNNDGFRAYTLTGWKIEDGANPNDQSYKALPWDPKRFDEDLDYRQAFMKRFGMTLVELDSFMKNYFARYGIEFDGNVMQIAKNSKEWTAHQKHIRTIMPKKYSMPNSELRVTYLDLESFRDYATEYTGINGYGRWLKRAGLPITLALVASGYGMPLAIMSGGIAGQGLSAAIDDSWKGFYGRAKVIRQDLAPTFELMSVTYKDKLNEMMAVIVQQQAEIQRLKNKY